MWARHWALGELTSAFAGLGEVSLDIQTVVSELATNAIQAQCQRLDLALDAHHSYVRVAVTDDAPGDPVPQEPDLAAIHGRGLLIVDALSTRWGVTRENGSKAVWADIPLDGDLGPTFDCAD
jgi:anti-sigma regulatory factor (Ser/Thr protein kinase)